MGSLSIFGRIPQMSDTLASAGTPALSSFFIRSEAPRILQNCLFPVA